MFATSERLQRQREAPYFDQGALAEHWLVICGDPAAPLVDNTAYLARLVGIPHLVVSPRARAPAGELHRRGIEAASDTKRVDASRSLARALLSHLGPVTLVIDVASFGTDASELKACVDSQYLYVAATPQGGVFCDDYYRAWAVSDRARCTAVDAVVDRLSAHLLLEHIARTNAFAPESGPPMPSAGPGEMRAVGWPALSTAGESAERLRVMIVGAGGLGSALVRTLAHSPLSALFDGGALILNDPDVWQPSNFNRVLTAKPADLHQPKAVTTAQYFKARVPQATVIAETCPFRASLLERYQPDVLVLATDSLSSRFEVATAARSLCGSALTVFAASDFEFGCARGHVYGAAASPTMCFEHGPEGLHPALVADEPAPGCTRTGGPANVLTNLLTAGAVAEIIATHEQLGCPLDAQILIDWLHPARVLTRGDLGACECSGVSDE